MPNGRKSICALVVSDELSEDVGYDVAWDGPPGTSAQRAISDLGDSFGVLGVWPAAWVAAQEVLTFCRRPHRATPRLLEIGCGAGLPALCALALGAEVVATDLEQLPLDLLEEAAEAQCLPGYLQTQTLDVVAALSPDRTRRGLAGHLQERGLGELESYDAIVCSDCLYKIPVAEAIGKFFARALLRRPTTKVIVTDANRRGRQAFLDALATELLLDVGDAPLPFFEATEVPQWAAEEAIDPFDGTSTMEVGLLRLA